jgi:hypothetical protein
MSVELMKQLKTFYAAQHGKPRSGYCMVGFLILLSISAVLSGCQDPSTAANESATIATRTFPIGKPTEVVAGQTTFGGGV